MSPSSPNHELDSIGAVCPPLIDLAALATDTSARDADEALIAHVSGCARCMAMLSELSAEAEAVDAESRLLLVPASVVHAAMSLRLVDARGSESDSPTIHVLPTWFTHLRRGAAVAACAAIALGGYRIGMSFGDAPQPAVTLASNTADDLYAFGLLELDGEDDDLFAMAFADDLTREATP